MCMQKAEGARMNESRGLGEQERLLFYLNCFMD